MWGKVSAEEKEVRCTQIPDMSLKGIRGISQGLGHTICILWYDLSLI